MLSSIKNAANTLTYATLGYDNNAAGKLSSVVYGNGVVTNYGYNPTSKRLTSLVATAPGGIIQNFSYSYDNIGNITGITDSAGSMSQNFIYDELSRLKLAVSAATYGSKYYEYDRTGNMIYNPDAQASGSSYYLDGTLSNATISGATWANGRLDQALSFDGNDTASIQNYDSPTKAISLEFWLRRLVSGTIIEKSGCYSITCDAQGTISGSLTMKNASVVTLSAAGADYNVWKHIVLTYDGATMKFYVNGSSVAAVVASGDIATNTNPIVLGSNFTGRLDELKISGNALSASEIAARYNAVPNIIPNQPLMPRVNSTGNVYTTYFTTASCWDTDGSQLKYIFDWGDSTEYTTTTFITNGSVVCSSHSWSALGEYFVRTRAIDERGGTSAWSPCYPLNIVSSHPNGVTLSANILIGASASLLECSSTKLSMTIGEPVAGIVTAPQANCRLGYPDKSSRCQSMLWDVVQTPYATGGTETIAPSKLTASQIAALSSNTTTQVTAIQSAITQNAGNTIKDAHGNTILANNRWIKYDYDNRPIKIVMPDGTQTEFTYDYQGQRVIKRHLDAQRAELTKTLYIGTIYEKNLTSSETIKQIHAATQRIATISSTDGLSYIHADHLGSTNKLTSGNQNTLGQVIRTTTYTPYGTTYASNGTADTTRKFTGQILDDNTGLYYYNARYYDPQLGTFLTPDLRVQDPYDPQYLNRYSYCRNNPVELIDPSGFDAIEFNDIHGVNLYDNWKGLGHTAVAIGTDSGHWYYYSRDGYDKGGFFKEYNSRNEMIKELSSRYEISHRYKTSPEQDIAMRKEATDALAVNYSIIGANCENLVERVLTAGGVIKGTSGFFKGLFDTLLSSLGIKTENSNSLIPNQAFSDRMINNPANPTITTPTTNTTTTSGNYYNPNPITNSNYDYSNVDWNNDASSNTDWGTNPDGSVWTVPKMRR